jgi:acetyl esterase/lipase
MSDARADDGLRITRTIPVPTSVSPHAQQVIAAGCASVAQRLANPPTYPPLDDAEAWKARIREMDQTVIGLFGARADAIDAAVERIEVDSVDVFVIEPPGTSLDDGPILLDIHGGALIAGGGEACRMMATLAAVRAGLPTWAVDYRMPPDHPYPAALDDCLAVYRALLEVRAPEQIVIDGSSAGGNLAAALLLRARDEGLPMPAALVLVSPEADLTESGDTFKTNEGVDYVIVQGVPATIALYAGGHELTDPYLSPVFGEFSGFPPTLLQSGTRDILLSNTVRLHRRMRAAGVAAELHVWEAMPHGGFFGAPEDQEVVAEIRAFVARALARPDRGTEFTTRG